MKHQILLWAAALAHQASAWSGQMAASGYFDPDGMGMEQIIYLTDLNTGSTYQGTLFGGFDACTSAECAIYFRETSPGGYNFEAAVWRTNDGCHNIDFWGAFGAHHGYCCGALPCHIST